MKRYFLLILGVIFILGCSSDNKLNDDKVLNKLTDSEIAEGWILLFDGKSLKGWRGIGIDEAPEGHWEIEKGTIRTIADENVPTLPDGEPLKGGDLITDRTFNNFELKFEFTSNLSNYYP